MGVIIGCLGGDWTPAFGDRGIQAWVTVLAYLACGFLAVLVWRDRPEPVLRRFWAFVAILMLFLAVNKQLDLQTALTETGRCLSMAQGWHGYRRYVQLLFIVIVGVVVLLILVRGVRMMRGYLPTHRLALTGTALVGAYVLIRATSFHAIDLFSSGHLLGLSVNFLLENAGLVLIALNAIWLLNGRIALDEPGRNRRRPETTPRTGQGAFTAAPPRQTTASENGDAEAAVEENRPFRPLRPRGH